MTEAELADTIAKLLTDAGYRVYSEVPFWLRRIDLVAISRDGRQLIAVEAKLTAWHKAVEQTRVYQLCAQHVVIAMPSRYVHRPDQSVLKKQGVGLWSVDEDIEEVVPPSPSRSFRPYFERRLRSTIETLYQGAGD